MSNLEAYLGSREFGGTGGASPDSIEDHDFENKNETAATYKMSYKNRVC